MKLNLVLMKNFKEIEAGTQLVYEQEAEAYAIQRGKSLFEKKWLDVFISKVGKNAKVLDVGCGPAEPIARYLIEKDLIVTGIDYSEPMIRIAKKNFPNNQWIIGNMNELNLKEKFQGIIAWNSFFHLNRIEQKTTLKKFAEHLGDNGVLLFTAGPSNGEVTGRVNGKEVYHSSLSLNEYKDILECNGMRLLDYKIEDPDCNSHCVFLFEKV